MRVLVTGGAGFLGRQVLMRLAANPQVESVIAIDNLDPLCGGQRCGAMYRGDIRSFQQIRNIIIEHDITAIVHLAAYGRNLTCRDFPRDAWEVNVTGTMNVLEAARVMNLERVVVCSSNIVLSEKLTVYGQTKKTCEDLVRLYASMGVSCMALRPSNIYGPGQSTTEYQLCAFADLDQTYSKIGRFRITGDGTQSRDWVHVKDVARAFALALFSDVTSETINISSGKTFSMNEVTALLGVPVEYVAARPGDAKTLISNPERAKHALGFTAELELEDHIREAFPCLTSAMHSQSQAG